MVSTNPLQFQSIPRCPALEVLEKLETMRSASRRHKGGSGRAGPLWVVAHVASEHIPIHWCWRGAACSEWGTESRVGLSGKDTVHMGGIEDWL